MDDFPLLDVIGDGGNDKEQENLQQLKRRPRERPLKKRMSGGYDCSRQRCTDQAIEFAFDPFSDIFVVQKTKNRFTYPMPPRCERVQAVYNSHDNRPRWTSARTAKLMSFIQRHGDRDFSVIAESMSSSKGVRSTSQFWKHPTSLACERWYQHVVKPIHDLRRNGNKTTIGEFLSSASACWLKEEDDALLAFGAVHGGGPIPRTAWASLQSTLPRHALIATIRRYQWLHDNFKQPKRPSKKLPTPLHMMTVVDATFSVAMLTFARQACAHDPYEEIEGFIPPAVFEKRVRLMKKRSRATINEASSDSDTSQ